MNSRGEHTNASMIAALNALEEAAGVAEGFGSRR